MLALIEALGDQGALRGAGVRLSEEFPVRRQRRARASRRARLGGVQGVRRVDRVSLRLGQIGRKLPTLRAHHGEPARDQDERAVHVRDGSRARGVDGRDRSRALRGLVSLSRGSSPCRARSARTARERQMARQFVAHALEQEKRPTDVFQSPEVCAHALDALTPNPDHMFWFEYNFLFVLAAEGRADKTALGDHGRAGYRQRARFYAVSAAGRLGYAKNVAEYLCFLAETTGQATSEACARAKAKLAAYSSYDALVADIAARRADQRPAASFTGGVALFTRVDVYPRLRRARGPRRSASWARYRLSGCHPRAVRVQGAGGQHRAAAEGARRLLVLAGAADHPVHHPGRVLDDVVLGLAVPDHAPAHRPAVAGAHRAAVAQLDAAVGGAAVVVQHAGGPALVRLGAAVAGEGAVEHDDRARTRRAPVATNQTLSALTVQRSSRTWLPLGANSAGLEEPWCLALRLIATRWSVMRRPPTPTLFIVSSMTRSRTQQSCAVDPQGREVRLRVADLLRRRLDVQLLDAHLGQPRRAARSSRRSCPAG